MPYIVRERGIVQPKENVGRGIDKNDCYVEGAGHCLNFEDFTEKIPSNSLYTKKDLKDMYLPY